MDDRTEHQPPLTRRDSALRYLCAAVPMLFFGVLMVMTASQKSGILREAVVDVGLGVAGLVLLRWRRRLPWQTALATALLTALSATATGPAYVAYVSLCTHRRWRRIVPVAAVSWLCLAIYAAWHGIDQRTVVSMVTGAAILGGLTVFGLYLRGLRDLDASRREAALAVEREQAQRVEQARLAERARIAHEMHDVLAHRISLLAMLAGGLAYRTDLTAGESREVALAIQENAHQSLNELRAVLGTLRSDGASRSDGAAEAPEPPQPGLDRLGDLFDEVRAAGQRVEVADAVEDRGLLPAQTGRHAYRIVQEALTNARKHAPGSRVRAEIGGRPGDGLRIRVSNPADPGAAAGPGGRLGLVGLAERTRMAGGTLSHAVRDGCFVLDARLPWEA
ncbi:sensor histidine kinase [Streptosporangium pseudovulgare]|uniref:histidine kinase n=1 Tax=Streptosporangium pseudovulgare TaxID=35765 RepID=A0ABQ2RIV4_9ACTN|nr:histidine kinase [Streptosporangium pseudovulgare]GGQ34610.1 two-component sensor histidine kinase [Streptosporangium pseudovulgare]